MRFTGTLSSAAGKALGEALKTNTALTTLQIDGKLCNISNAAAEALGAALEMQGKLAEARKLYWESFGGEPKTDGPILDCVEFSARCFAVEALCGIELPQNALQIGGEPGIRVILGRD